MDTPDKKDPAGADEAGTGTSAPDKSRSIEAPHLGILEMLRKIAVVFERQKLHNADNARFVGDSELIMIIKDRESFIYVDFLNELLRRIDNNELAAERLTDYFTEEMIRHKLRQALAVIASSGDYAPQLVFGKWTNPKLDELIENITEYGLLEYDDLREPTGNTIYDEFKSDWLAHQRPTMLDLKTIQPAQQPPSGPVKTMPTAGGIFQSSSLAGVAQVTARVKTDINAGAKIPSLEATIVGGFPTIEPPTIPQRRTQVIPAVPAQPAVPQVQPAPEASRAHPVPSAPSSPAESAEKKETVIMLYALALVDEWMGNRAPVPENGEKSVHEDKDARVETDFKYEPLIRYPMLYVPGEDFEMTIGSDPSCDIVFPEGFYGEVAPVHAKLTIKDKKVVLSNEQQLIKMDDQLVKSSDPPELKKGQVFCLAGSGKNKVITDGQPHLMLEERVEIPEEELKETVKERLKRLYGIKARLLKEYLEQQDEAGKRKTDQDLYEIRNKIKTFCRSFFCYRGYFKQGEKESLASTGLEEVASIIDERLKGNYREIGRILTNFVEDVNREMVRKPEDYEKVFPGEITMEFVKQKQSVTSEEIEKIDALAKFADENGIPFPAEDQREERIKALIETAKNLLEDYRVAAKAVADAAFEKEKQEEEIRLAPFRLHDKLMAEYVAGYPEKGQFRHVHCAPGELLDGTNKPVYKGPVIMISDSNTPDYDRVDPVLFEEMTIGDHRANTHRLNKALPGSSYKYPTRPFMATVRKDKEGKLHMTWIDGVMKFLGTSAPPQSPTFQLKEGTVVQLGPHHLTVEDGHGYTPKRLQYEGPRMAKELLEIIFDMDQTSGHQNSEALQNLLAFLREDIIGKEFLAEHLRYFIAGLWENIAAWNPDREDVLEHHDELEDEEDTCDPARINGRLRVFVDTEMEKKPLCDAHYLRTLNMLMNLKGTVLPREVFTFPQQPQDFELTFNHVRKQVEIRIKSYIDLQHQALVPERSWHLINKEKKIREEREAIMKKSRKAASGAIEIARLIEMGFTELHDVAEIPDVPDGYIDNISRILEIRGKIAEFSGNAADVTLFRKIKKLAKGRLIRQIFSPEEIELANHNIEVSLKGLKADSSVEYYLNKLAAAVGRKIFRRALREKDPRHEAELLRALLEEGLLQAGDLMMKETDEPEEGGFLGPEAVEALLADIFRKAARINNMEQRIDLRNRRRQERDEKRERSLDRRLEMLETTICLVEEKIEQARAEFKMAPLFEIAATMADRNIDERMFQMGIALPGYELSPGNGRTRAGRLPRVYGALKPKTWAMLKEEFYDVARQLGMAEAGFMITDDDAFRHFLRIKKGVAKGLFTYADLGVTEESLQKEIEAGDKRVKIEKLRDKYRALFADSTSKLSSMKYLKQVQADTLTDEDEKTALAETVDEISMMKMRNIIKNFEKGEDVFYMKMLAKKLILAGYDPRPYFSAEQIALTEEL